MCVRVKGSRLGYVVPVPMLRYRSLGSVVSGSSEASSFDELRPSTSNSCKPSKGLRSSAPQLERVRLSSFVSAARGASVTGLAP